ncbi:FdhD protein [Paracidovorax konjaci]|uniref:Sulfur carrier protein FdhD n=1 Tax=Paracidovorax konjaci TaxID=32040 RepID=A0A1I1SL09_9BURK|nr:FdhD protein [Paracidovorax konjaci]
MADETDGLTAALLSALAELDGPQGVSLPRLAKRLGLSGSVLLRRLHWFSDARLGGTPGPGWVQVVQDGERWMVRLTEAGRAQAGTGVGTDTEAGGDTEAGAQASAGAAVPAPSAACLPAQSGTGDPARNEPAALPGPVVARAVQRHAAAGAAPGASLDAGASPLPVPAWQDDAVAAEVPVALVFNGLSHAVMMATPSDLDEFALGFALSEGLIDTPADCRGIEVFSRDGAEAGVGAACEVHLDIAPRCFARLKERRRALAGRTGCGLCGIDSLQALDLVPERVAQRPWVAALPAAAVLRAVAAMPPLQVLNAAAGALHAAAWATPDGELTDLLEDVGRHNALDKLIGRLAAQGRSGEEGFVVMSSRASYELVRKCARRDIPLLATVSAPTSLAVDLAGQAGMVLWGLCRPPRAVRYAG